MKIECKKNHKLLWILSYGYLAIPVIIFLLGWVKLYISIPISVCIIYSFILVIRNTPNVKIQFSQNRVRLAIVFVLLFVWTIYSGVGGLMWQNRWDHMFRNAIFSDLVRFQWPVINHSLAVPRTLCYYLGFWLPSALIGKLFGYQAGYAFQFIWAYIGVTLSFLLLSEYLKRVSIRAAALFILFSGLDIFIYLQYKIRFHQSSAILSELLNGEHIELILGKFNSSSNTTLLFWLYNQTIPFWVGFLLILQQERNQSRLFTFILMVLFAPFPAIALVPLVIYQCFSTLKPNENRLSVKLKEVLKSCISIENITGIAVGFIIALYYMSNAAVQKVGFAFSDRNDVVKFILFLLSEYVVYLILIFKNAKRDRVLIVLLLTMLICSFVQLGNSSDFAWRTCIPSSFYLMLLVMKEVLDKTERKSWKRMLLYAVILFGCITPLLEFTRTTEHTIAFYSGSKSDEDSLTSNGLKSVFDENVCYDNFIGTQDSIFGKYIERSE